MAWKRAVRAAVTRAAGLERRKMGSRRSGRWRSDKARSAPGDRLVIAPAFILCTLRSGSTLLRVLLNSHSRLHAPHELHLRHVAVRLTSRWSRTAMNELGLDPAALEYLLWDRILHRELARSGKDHIVCKTPNDVFIADRIRECWPDVRFVFLLRHPAGIVRSRRALRPGIAPGKNVELIERYCRTLEAARSAHPGHTVRYEDLTADPVTVTQGICEFLGVPWEREMLDYGRFEHGGYRAGLGDWRDKIRAGEVQPAAPPPPVAEIPPGLRDLAEAWGYVGEDAGSPERSRDPSHAS